MSYSDVDIANRALSKLGASRISSLSDGSVNARAASACIAILKDAELRKHPWNFAIEKASLPADGTAPAWGRNYSYTLPANFIRLLPDYPEDVTNDKDWQIEGNQIFTDDGAPLHIRYIKLPSTITDPLFVEALSSKMAEEMCEEITQSNQKKADCIANYKEAIKEAKKANAFENPSQEFPEDLWITVRA